MYGTTFHELRGFTAGKRGEVPQQHSTERVQRQYAQGFAAGSAERERLAKAADVPS